MQASSVQGMEADDLLSLPIPVRANHSDYHNLGDSRSLSSTHLGSLLESETQLRSLGCRW